MCPVVYALGVIGQEWKLPILWHLFQQEVTRYSELKQSVRGVTNMMLTKSLHELVEHGLVTRRQNETVPPQGKYSLAERGWSLLPTLSELYKWGEEQMRLDKLRKA